MEKSFLLEYDYSVLCWGKSVSLHRELDNTEISYEQSISCFVLVLRFKWLGTIAASYHAVDAGISL